MGPVDKIREILSTIRRTAALAERGLRLSAQGVTDANRQRLHIRDLSDVEASAYSQWGEDGIIDWLIERLTSVTPTFVEFGVEDYRESNTRFLLQQRNWKGLVIDGSEANVAAIRGQDLYWRHDLTAVASFISRENINQIIQGAGISGDVGLLSIDIDGNDYWVWEAIECISPAIVVCEYNAVFGDLKRLSIPYDPEFQRTIAHPSNLFFGASLPALTALGERKGYRFIGTASSGGNAFFVREDHAGAVLGSLGRIRGFPSKFREARAPDGSLLFVGSEERVRLIEQLEVFDFDVDSLVSLHRYDTLYSESWQAAQ